MAKIFGQLEEAQLQNKSSNPSAGKKGLFWHNVTDLQSYIDDGSDVAAVLQNNQRAIFGRGGAASANVRFHRGGTSRLQIVRGDDVTADGSAVTGSLAEFSARVENYTNAGKPTFGQRGRMVYVTDREEFQFDTGSEWKAVGGGALIVTGSRAAPSAIAATGGIAFTGTQPRQLWFVEGAASGQNDISATAQIAAGSAVGQELILVGRNNDKSILLEDGNGLAMNGSFEMVENSVIGFMWDTTSWVEMFRRP